MTKVFIIDLDLGATVDNIINDEVQTITGESRRILDNALEHQKVLQEARNRRDTAKKTATDTLTKVMSEAYNQLVEAGEEGIPVETLISNASPTVPNSSAFTLRMKNILKEKGNPFRLVRKQRKKIPTYIFEPFNEETN